MRKGFNFYKSYYDQMKLMTDKQRSQLFIAICEVQFLEKNINDVDFKDPLLNIVWQGATHSVETSLKGYISREKSLGRDVSVPLEGGNKNNFNPSEQVQVQEEVQEEVQVQVQVQEKECNGSTVVELSTTLLSGIKVSEYLLSKILVNKPNFRKPNLEVYSDEGSFWIPNILSAKKLREKFDTMESQMTTRKIKSQTMVDKIYDNGMSAQDVIKEMEKRA